jgi:hypothetical protein
MFKQLLSIFIKNKVYTMSDGKANAPGSVEEGTPLLQQSEM